MSLIGKRFSSTSVAVLLGVSAVVLVATGSGAGAATTPPYEPDPGSVGTVTFYDASGNVQTSGSINDHPIAAYAVGSAVNRAGDTTANLIAAQPNPNANIGLWNKDFLGAFTTYPLTTGPANIRTLSQTKPVATGVSTDLSVNDFIGEFPNTKATDSNTAYQDLYQLRLYSANGGNQSTTYNVADILVDETANTWTQVYPAPAAQTSTAIGAITPSPAAPAEHGSTVTLTATLTATGGSHPAGSVELFDGTTDKGAATLNAATGAISATDTPTDGAHSYTFKFTPADTVSYAGSTSPALAYTVNPIANVTSTLTASPNSPATVGDTVTLTDTLSPTSAAGSVQFFDGTTALGAPVTPTAGVATYHPSSASAGSFNFTAKFTPADVNAYAASTSNAIAYTINPAATPTTTVLATSPSGSAAYGSPVTLTATVGVGAGPAPTTGTVHFYDGTVQIGTATVGSSSTATATVSTLAAGSHSLTAQFVPADATVYQTSTSPAQALTITKLATTTAVSSASTVQQNSTITLTATVSPSTATGTVQFTDGGSNIGSAATVSNGTATLTTSFSTTGTHTIDATYTPSGAQGGNYLGSSSTTSDVITVTPPPPAASTIALSFSPANPVVQGHDVVLTATVGPSGAAGSVQFHEGTTLLSTVAVSGGKATTTVTAPSTGDHSYTATFVPSNNFTSSTSPAVTVHVIPPPTATTTALTVTPAGPVAYGASVTLAAQVTPASGPAPSTGTVDFYDGTTKLASSAVSSGAASTTVSNLSSGTHQLSAKFVPADVTLFSTSSSAATSLTVNAQPTTTTLSLSPGTTISQGDALTLKAAVSPTSATGAVEFFDGTTSLGKGTVSGGKASLIVSTLGIGSHSLTAQFQPASAALFDTSTSAASTVTVDKAAQISGVTSNGSPVASGATLKPGTALSITAVGFAANEAVTASIPQLHLTLGTVNADANGAVSAPVVIPASIRPGNYTIVLSGAIAHASFAFTVAAPPVTTPSGSSSGTTSGTGTTTVASSGSGSSLASTGSNVIGAIGLGLLLIIGGAGALVISRRRVRQH